MAILTDSLTNTVNLSVSISAIQFSMESYVTVDEAEGYFGAKLNAEPWDDAIANNKQKSLRQATLIIDLLNFAGSKAVSTQSLQFPRGTDTLVPMDIKYATCEVALALLDGVDPEKEFAAQNVISYRYDRIKTDYDRNIPQDHIVSGVLSITAWRYLQPYIRTSSGMILSRV